MRISIGDVTLFVEIIGQQYVLAGNEMVTRPTLIGLHGGPGQDGTTLRHHLASLSDVAQLVVPDQRGHGRSDPGNREDWNLDRWAADVHHLCEALGIFKPIVLGQSFGGFVAQQYAAAFPQELAGLVLVSTAPRYPGPREVIARARELLGDETAEALRRDIENPSHGPSPEDQQLMRSLYRQHSDHQLERLEQHIIKTPEVAHRWVTGAQRSMDLRPALGLISCPTLVLVGELDPLNPPALATEIIEAIPPGLSRLDIVPGAAHRVLGDNPGYTLGSIRGFISSL